MRYGILHASTEDERSLYEKSMQIIKGSVNLRTMTVLVDVRIYGNMGWRAPVYRSKRKTMMTALLQNASVRRVNVVRDFDPARECIIEECAEDLRSIATELKSEVEIVVHEKPSPYLRGRGRILPF